MVRRSGEENRCACRLVGRGDEWLGDEWLVDLRLILVNRFLVNRFLRNRWNGNRQKRSTAERRAMPSSPILPSVSRAPAPF
ncbi:MAG: hypothetical protein GY924_07130 [Planctomycetaceae bacterium]|nr:hypothetical protein [Planctomycetaceae bacterium]